jgi:hypothetical protein
MHQPATPPLSLCLANLSQMCSGKFLRETSDQQHMEVKLEDKLLRACAKMRLKAGERKQSGRTGSTEWELKAGLRRRAPWVVQGSLASSLDHLKARSLFYIVLRLISPLMFEVSDVKGKVRGLFIKQSLKPYYGSPALCWAFATFSVSWCSAQSVGLL